MPPINDTKETPEMDGEKSCRAHGDIMESIGYIRGRIDEIADRSSRMEIRLDYAIQQRPGSSSAPIVSVSSGTTTSGGANDGKSSNLLAAIVALIFAVAALLGASPYIFPPTPTKPPAIVSVGP